VGPARTDDDAGVYRLGGVLPVHELGQDAVPVQLQLLHGDPALNRAAQ
jgi:hypothetical protein